MGNDRLRVLGALVAVMVVAAARMTLVAGRDGGFSASPGTGVPTPSTPHAATPRATKPGPTPAATSDLFAALPEPSHASTVVAAATPSPTTPANKIGVLPGHWQFDSGAVCPDGLREVDITVDVGLRVRALLEYRGFDVELLPEHEPGVPQPPLQGFRAAALVAIHADSCSVTGASGFKVSRGIYSTTPLEDDRLVACLEHEYTAATLMPRHDGSITLDMSNYYAFREVDSTTPAAIIELGFMHADRAAMDRLRYEMALGIANGVSCFARR